MERLQQALQKARARQPGAGLSRDRRDGARGPVDWETVPEIQIGTRLTRRRRLVALSGGSDATPFDVLRTKLLHMARPKGWKRVIVTSPTPGAGKTTTTMNLALALARHRDLKVIVIDLDMRRPALAKALGCKVEDGVEKVLTRRMPFEQQARRIGPNLLVSMNGKPVADPSDLFLRQTTADVINGIEARFQPDLMLFDMPPVMVNDDTQAFLKQVDCAIIVAEAGVATISQIDLCEKELSEQTEVVGVVLNKCRYRTDAFGYYHYGEGY